MQLGRVVVGVDFGAASLAAAQWVGAHLAPRAEVVLVHVLPEPEAPAFLRPRLPAMLDVVSDVVPALHGGLRGLADLIGSDRTRIEMLTGAPADGLAAAAADVGADLVCVGRTRSRRGGARFGATVAQRLLARTSTPVLVVPGARGAAPSRIVAALDGSASSATVAGSAWRLARRGGASVQALHVLGPELRGFVRACRRTREEHVGDRGRSPLVVSRAGDMDRIRDEAQLYALAGEWTERQFAALGAPPGSVSTHVRVGDPGQEIVAFARSTGAELIVVGRGDAGDATGERSALEGGLRPLGSTARLVTWVAPCPVLVVAPAGAGGPGPHSGRGARWRRPPLASRGTRLLEGEPSGPLLPAA